MLPLTIPAVLNGVDILASLSIAIKPPVAPISFNSSITFFDESSSV